MDVKFTDNSDKTLEEFNAAMMRALERIGSQAEGYAKDLCPVDTGRLRNSIGHTISQEDGGGAAYIGSNVEYAGYV